MSFLIESTLERFESLFIETTSKEKFELKKAKEGGYLLIDVEPPIFEKNISEYRSFKISKHSRKALNNLKNNPGYDYSTSDMPIQFDGLEKGAHFGFSEADKDEWTLSKGKIDSVYLVRRIDGIVMHIHLIEPAGKKLYLFHLMKKSFVIETKRDRYEFIKSGDQISFEGREVIGLYSIFSEFGSLDNRSLPGCPYILKTGSYSIYHNRPLLVITKNEDSLPITSFLFDPVKNIVR